jgi:hypothetical protein
MSGAQPYSLSLQSPCITTRAAVSVGRVTGVVAAAAALLREEGSDEQDRYLNLSAIVFTQEI